MAICVLSTQMACLPSFCAARQPLRGTRACARAPMHPAPPVAHAGCLARPAIAGPGTAEAGGTIARSLGHTHCMGSLAHWVALPRPRRRPPIVSPPARSRRPPRPARHRPPRDASQSPVGARHCASGQGGAACLRECATIASCHLVMFVPQQCPVHGFEQLHANPVCSGDLVHQHRLDRPSAAMPSSASTASVSTPAFLAKVRRLMLAWAVSISGAEWTASAISPIVAGIRGSGRGDTTPPRPA